MFNHLFGFPFGFGENSLFTVGYDEENKKESCKHVENMKVLEKCKKSIMESKCKKCKKFVKNRWICVTCGKINCGNEEKEHALKHYRNNPSHCIAMSLEDLSFWCYKCNNYVVDERLDTFYSIFHFLKFGYYPENSYIKSPVYELPDSERRKDFENYSVQSPVFGKEFDFNDKEDYDSNTKETDDYSNEKPETSINENPFLNDMKKILRKHGFKYKSFIDYDGNCQFTSVADLIFDDPRRGDDVREAACDWLEQNYSQIDGFLDKERYGNWKNYIKHMRKDGSWGDQISLVGIANAYKIEINVLSNVIPEGYKTTVKIKKKPKLSINLCLYHNFHYRSIVPINE